MEVYKDSWHYRAWEYWLKASKGKRAWKYRKEFYGTTRDTLRAQSIQEDDSPFIVEEAEEEPGLFIIYRGLTQQPNLCIYFWVAVLRTPLLKIAHNEKFHIAGSIALAYGIAVLFGSLLFGEVFGFGMHLLLVWIVYPLAIAATAAIAIGLVILFFRLQEWYRFEREIPEKDTQKGPNILTEYVKANKNKVCPLLEFKEKEPA